MSQKDNLLDAIRRNNLDELRTLVSMQKCIDEAHRNILLSEAVELNRTEITKYLLQVECNPNSRSRSKALHIAARNGNLEIIEMLLNHGADINAKDNCGGTPLVCAIHCKNEDAAELLLERGACFSDYLGKSPLHIAASVGSLRIIKMLLQNGASVYTVITIGYEKGYTPLHCACSFHVKAVDIEPEPMILPESVDAVVPLLPKKELTSLQIASQNVQIIDLLLNYNSEINVRAKNSYTPLYLAIAFENEDAALLLIKRGAKLDLDYAFGNKILSMATEKGLSSTVEEILCRCPDPDPEREIKRWTEFFAKAVQMRNIELIESVLKNRSDLSTNFDDIINSLLHMAVKSKQIKSVKVSIAHGADVNADDGWRRTPLHYAVHDVNVEMTKLLISHGADVQSSDQFGRTALHEVASVFNLRFNRGIGSSLQIVKMLLAAGADVNAATKTSKQTPLHFGCEHLFSNLVEIFLEHNADVNLKDKTGKTAIQIAARHYEESTKFLLENRATVNLQDFYGCTALHNAIDSERSGIIRLLLDFGADINIKNRNNNSPMDIAFLKLKPREGYRMYYYNLLIYLLQHAFALDAVNLYYGKDLRSSLSKLGGSYSDVHFMGSHFENCKQEIEKLKSLKVPGHVLTYYAMMKMSIHSLARYVKNENVITDIASVNISQKFPIYGPIFKGRLRNSFQRRLLIADTVEFFQYYFQLPHVCVEHILSYLSLDDLKNITDAM